MKLRGLLDRQLGGPRPLERLPALIADLVQHKVSVIAATGTNAAVAAKRATTTIPIVFEMGSDPVELGLVASLSQPGSNVTGVTNFTVDIGSKQLGLLRELVPGTTAIAALMNPNFAGVKKELGMWRPLHVYLGFTSLS